MLVRRAEKILAGADRCARIVRNFLALARQHPPKRKPVGLNDRPSHRAARLRSSHDNVEVVLNLADDVPAVWGAGTRSTRSS